MQQSEHINKMGSFNEEKKEIILQALYKHLRQQQQVNTQQQPQQEAQFDRDFEANQNQQQQQVSTPINMNAGVPPSSYLERDNPLRKSFNLGENLQKPTPDDKMRYFKNKPT